MNVSMSGTAAAMLLPMTLASSSRGVPEAATGGQHPTTTGVTSGPGRGGEVKLPGRHPAAGGAHEAAAKQKEPVKLPMLRGLTVAEIRAMLGVAPLPGQTETSAAALAGSPSIISAALENYV